MDQSSGGTCAALLAKQLSCELITDAVTLSHLPCDYALVVDKTGVSLHGVRCFPDYGGLRVDFLALGQTDRYRRLRIDDVLARAVGMKPHRQPSVLDLTAGLGRDAYVLACLGCTVQLVERHPLVYALLNDGLRRARLQGDRACLRMQAVCSDALTFLSQWDNKAYADKLCTDAIQPDRKGGYGSDSGGLGSSVLNGVLDPDVIYLDPMYLSHHKSAKVKKEMQYLRDLLPKGEEDGDLLQKAMSVAKGRVVVKRGRKAAWFAGMKPNACVQAKRCRFDLYLAS